MVAVQARCRRCGSSELNLLGASYLSRCRCLNYLGRRRDQTRPLLAGGMPTPPSRTSNGAVECSSCIAIIENTIAAPSRYVFIMRISEIPLFSFSSLHFLTLRREEQPKYVHLEVVAVTRSRVTFHRLDPATFDPGGNEERKRKRNDEK